MPVDFQIDRERSDFVSAGAISQYRSIPSGDINTLVACGSGERIRSVSERMANGYIRQRRGCDGFAAVLVNKRRRDVQIDWDIRVFVATSSRCIKRDWINHRFDTNLRGVCFVANPNADVNRLRARNVFIRNKRQSVCDGVLNGKVPIARRRI